MSVDELRTVSGELSAKRTLVRFSCGWANDSSLTYLCLLTYMPNTQLLRHWVHAHRLQLRTTIFLDLMVQKHLHVNTFGQLIDIPKSDETIWCLQPEYTEAAQLLTAPVTTRTVKKVILWIEKTRLTPSFNNVTSTTQQYCASSLSWDVDSTMKDFISKRAVQRNTCALLNLTRRWATADVMRNTGVFCNFFQLAVDDVLSSLCTICGTSKS